jgi:hypothetical protein
MDKENKKCKHESKDEEDESEDEEDEEDEEGSEDDSENEDEEESEDEEENEDKNKEDKNDVVYKFLELVRKKEITFIITGGAFNVMCDTNREGHHLIRISPMVYWAYGEIQLVMCDVLERLDNKKYKEKTVKDLVLAKTRKNYFVGHFMYKDVKFLVDSVDNYWTLCLMNKQ